jgi:tubulin-folding cofactor B
VLAFKKRNKMGRFAEPSEIDSTVSTAVTDDYSEEASRIKIGDRCLVDQGHGLEKKGSVQFVGLAQFKPGYWVGVQYDEPLGKHNGT